MINLAGESIAGGRWTRARKAVFATAACAPHAHAGRGDEAPATRRPAFLNGSAVGIYGPRGDEPLTEETRPAPTSSPHSASRMGRRGAGRRAGHARRAAAHGPRARDASGGALPQMALPFQFFAGGPIGLGPPAGVVDSPSTTGWRWCAGRWRRAASGPLNVTAPNPVTNAEFARTLGRSLGRPAIMPVPAFALRLALGRDGRRRS